jgi:hypothetical protein
MSLSYQPRFDPRGDRYRKAIIKSTPDRQMDETGSHMSRQR